jgi:hypothetical protein
MSHIDLDQKRSEREPLIVIFGGEEFKAPHGIPLAFWDLASTNDFKGAMGVLFGEADGERFMANEPTTEDMVDLAKGLAEVVGFGDLAGNPTPSPGSSAKTGRPSKPTGQGSTRARS